MTDVQFSTVVFTNDTSVRPTVLERVEYSAYGKARHHRSADLNDDGATNGFDQAILLAAWSSPGVHIADLNRDGNIDGFDQAILLSDWSAAQPEGALSIHGNIIGWDGYLFNAEAEQYHVRHRVYEPVLGRWLERDPLQYIDGMNLYGFVGQNPICMFDPWGLERGAEWHHIIKKKYFEPGGILHPFRCLKDSLWNGWIVPPAVHDLTRHKFYEEALKKLLGEHDWTRMTEAEAKAAMKRVVEEMKKKFKDRIFQFGYQADIPFKRSAELTAEATEKLRKLGLLGVVLVSGLIISEANASNAALMQLFQQFNREANSGKWAEANALALELTDKMDYFGSSPTKLIIYNALHDEFNRIQHERALERMQQAGMAGPQ